MPWGHRPDCCWTTGLRAVHSEYRIYRRPDELVKRCVIPRSGYVPLAAMDEFLQEPRRCAREGTPRPERLAVQANTSNACWAFKDLWDAPTGIDASLARGFGAAKEQVETRSRTDYLATS